MRLGSAPGREGDGHKHLRVLDRNLKNSKDSEKLELFDFQIFQILAVLELEILEY